MRCDYCKKDNGPRTQVTMHKSACDDCYATLLLEWKIKDLRRFLKLAHTEITQMRLSGDAGNWDETRLEKDIKNILEEK